MSVNASHVLSFCLASFTEGTHLLELEVQLQGLPKRRTWAGRAGAKQNPLRGELGGSEKMGAAMRSNFSETHAGGPRSALPYPLSTSLQSYHRAHARNKSPPTRRLYGLRRQASTWSLSSARPARPDPPRSRGACHPRGPVERAGDHRSSTFRCRCHSGAGRRPSCTWQSSTSSSCEDFPPLLASRARALASKTLVSCETLAC